MTSTLALGTEILKIVVAPLFDGAIGIIPSIRDMTVGLTKINVPRSIESTTTATPDDPVSFSLGVLCGTTAGTTTVSSGREFTKSTTRHNSLKSREPTIATDSLTS
jgi:hypothetical protein